MATHTGGVTADTLAGFLPTRTYCYAILIPTRLKFASSYELGCVRGHDIAPLIAALYAVILAIICGFESFASLPLALF